ncbi:hypothetical protein GCM10022225_63230 [Plantactinospora mayteni]|uniref:Uncharacterized protein n=1 Tax=Plantactinospora mayteni TaxID=566021 RepID=A0ABQ4F012_9ACTN|nr:hypothetical protein Pma05_68250 [Plantactinospora mayteni]
MRQQARADVGDADLRREPGGGAWVVAGQELRCRAGQRGEPGHGVGGAGADLVGQAEHAGGFTIDPDHDRGTASPLQFVNGGA